MHTWYLRYLEGRIAELERRLHALDAQHRACERGRAGRDPGRRASTDAAANETRRVVEIPVNDGDGEDDEAEGEPGGPGTDPERAYV